MITDPTIREQGYLYFLTEAPELLQLIEQELLNLSEDRSTAKVHSLMRATHTIKGGAANVGLEAIKTVAHSLEDVLKALYNPDLVIDAPLQTLLMQGYECLRLPLMAELTGSSVNEDEVLDRAASVFAQLQAKLGDYFGDQAFIPSSVELGFDIAQSLFEMGVGQRLESIAVALEESKRQEEESPLSNASPLNGGNPRTLLAPQQRQSALRAEPPHAAGSSATPVRSSRETRPRDWLLSTHLLSQAEVFVGLAESLNLPGFKAIAETTLAAIQAQPTQVLKIAEIALADFQQAREAVLAGDRTRGGEPSAALQQLARVATDVATDVVVGITDELSVGPIDDSSATSAFKSAILTSELKHFYKFLTSDAATSLKHRQKIIPVELKVANFYLDTIRYILGWFQHEVGIPQENFCLALLVPNNQHKNEDKKNSQEVENDVKYLQEWVNKFLNFLQDDQDTQSLCLYREGCILVTLLAVAKFQYLDENDDESIYKDSSIIQSLNYRVHEVAKEYKKHSPVTDEEKQWLKQPKLQKLIALEEISVSPSEEHTDNLIEKIWGEQDSSLVFGQQSADISQPSSVIAHSSLVNDNQQRTTNNKQTTDKKQSVRVDLEGLERLNHLAGEMLITHNRQTLQDEQLKEAVQKLLEQLRQHQQTLNQLRDWSEISRQILDFRLPILDCWSARPVVQGKIQNHASSTGVVTTGVSPATPSLLNGENPAVGCTPVRIKGGTPAQKNRLLGHRPSTRDWCQNPKSIDFDSIELDQYTELHLLLHSALEETLQLEEATEFIDVLVTQSSQTLEKQQRFLSNIRDDLVEARMLPLGNIFNRFTQMVQKLGTTYGKSVELKLRGTNVLVDKAIAEKLYDPLLHLVRNAFDHGIESPDVRRQCGKPEQGLIEICAYQQRSQTIIEVRDDGKGLDIERIRRRAIEMNLLPSEEPVGGVQSTPTPSQLLEVLFEPGFSTAQELSDLSGRGIGLDVVRSQLQILKGSIMVQSSPQQGTTFSLQIPSSMTTAKVLIVQAGGAVYGLLLETVEKFLVPSSNQIKEFEGKKILHWGTGQDQCMVRLHQLSDLMHYTKSLVISQLPVVSSSEQRTTDNGQLTNAILLLRRNTELLGLEVDQVLGEQELVIRPLGSAIAPPKYVYGCSVLGNGRLILVIDGAALVSCDRQEATDLMLPATTSNSKALPLPASSVQSQLLLTPATEITAVQTRPTAAPRSNQVLVVDDAISVRQTLTLTLQKHGYEVLQAQDGLDALEQLRQNPAVTLVVSDLEMPHMNGFEFLSNVRQDPALAKTPVVILTSRSAEKHRQFAQELGATAYFTKPYLEQELLATLAELSNIKSG